MPLKEEQTESYNNRVLRRTREPKRGEIIGGWRKTE
jgi:hypothetical protein